MAKVNQTFLRAKKFAQLLIDIEQVSGLIEPTKKLSPFIEKRSYAFEPQKYRDESNMYRRIFQRQGRFKSMKTTIIMTNASLVVKQPFEKTHVFKVQESTPDISSITEEILFQNSLVLTKEEEFNTYVTSWLKELGYSHRAFYLRTLEWQTLYGMLKAAKDIVQGHK